jgi:hypothetical protein
MPGTKYILASLVFALAGFAWAGPSEANWDARCGFDRYGYHPPSWRGCGRVSEVWDVPPPVRAVRAHRVARHHVHRSPPTPVVAAPAAAPAVVANVPRREAFSSYWDGPPPPRPVSIYHVPHGRAYRDLPPALYAGPVYGTAYRGGPCHYDNGWYEVIIVCN